MIKSAQDIYFGIRAGPRDGSQTGTAASVLVALHHLLVVPLLDPSLQKSCRPQGKADDGRTIQKTLFHFEHFSEPWRAGPPLLRIRRRRRRQRKSRRSVAIPFLGTASARGGYGLSHPRRGMAITNTMVCQHKVPMTRTQEPVLVTRYRCSMGRRPRRCKYRAYRTRTSSVPRHPSLAARRIGELTLKVESICCVPVPSLAELTASSHGRKLLMPGIEDSEAYIKRRDGLAKGNMHERLEKARTQTAIGQVGSLGRPQ